MTFHVTIDAYCHNEQCPQFNVPKEFDAENDLGFISLGGSESERLYRGCEECSGALHHEKKEQAA